MYVSYSVRYIYLLIWGDNMSLNLQPAQSVAQRIRLLRETLGMTQKEVSDATGVDTITWNRYENSRTPFGERPALSLAKMCHVDPAWIWIGDARSALRAAEKEVKLSHKELVRRAAAAVVHDVFAVFELTTFTKSQRRREPIGYLPVAKSFCAITHVIASDSGKLVGVDTKRLPLPGQQAIVCTQAGVNIISITGNEPRETILGTVCWEITTVNNDIGAKGY